MDLSRRSRYVLVVPNDDRFSRDSDSYGRRVIGDDRDRYDTILLLLIISADNGLSLC